VALVVRQETEAVFRARLDSRMARRIAVHYVHQLLGQAGLGSPPRTKPWGTGQAVLAAASAVDGPFAVVNADDYYGPESYATLARFLARATADRRLAAVGFRLADTLTDAGAVSRAVLDVDDEGRLRHIVEILEIRREGGRIAYRAAAGEEKVLAGGQLVSMNMWGFTPALLPELGRRFALFAKRFGGDPGCEFRLPDVIQELVAEDLFRVEVLPASGQWCGLTFRQDEDGVRSVVRSLIAQGSYPPVLWAAG
jgi:hypothetical protein